MDGLKRRGLFRLNVINFSLVGNSMIFIIKRRRFLSFCGSIFFFSLRRLYFSIICEKGNYKYF